MVVAKRQGREKPAKMEQRKFRGLEWGPQVGQTALLAGLDSPVYIGQAQGEEKTQKEEPRGPESPCLSFLRVLWISMPLCLKDVFSFIFWITLISPRTITQTVWELWCAKGFNVYYSKFLLRRDRTEITLLWQYQTPLPPEKIRGLKQTLCT